MSMCFSRCMVVFFSHRVNNDAFLSYLSRLLIALTFYNVLYIFQLHNLLTDIMDSLVSFCLISADQLSNLPTFFCKVHNDNRISSGYLLQNMIFWFPISSSNICSIFLFLQCLIDIGIKSRCQHLSLNLNNPIYVSVSAPSGIGVSKSNPSRYHCVHIRTNSLGNKKIQMFSLCQLLIVQQTGLVVFQAPIQEIVNIEFKKKTVGVRTVYQAYKKTTSLQQYQAS